MKPRAKTNAPRFLAEIHLAIAHANLVDLLKREPSNTVTRAIAADRLTEWITEGSLDEEQRAALETALAHAIAVAATSSRPQAAIPKSLALDLADVLLSVHEWYGPDHVFTQDIQQQLSAIADGAGVKAMRRMYRDFEEMLKKDGTPLDWRERQAELHG